VSNASTLGEQVMSRALGVGFQPRSNGVLIGSGKQDETVRLCPADRLTPTVPVGHTALWNVVDSLPLATHRAGRVSDLVGRELAAYHQALSAGVRHDRVDSHGGCTFQCQDNAGGSSLRPQAELSTTDRQHWHPYRMRQAPCDCSAR
jgi:hypothetical protein